MTASNHAVFGALIAVTIPHPVIAIPLALASHFVLDSLPHYGKSNRINFPLLLGIDGTLVLILLSLLTITKPDHWQLMVICALVALSPDFMWLPGYIRELKKLPAKPFNLIMKFHSIIQWGERPYGMSIEVPWLIAMSFILLTVAR